MTVPPDASANSSEMGLGLTRLDADEEDVALSGMPAARKGDMLPVCGMTGLFPSSICMKYVEEKECRKIKLHDFKEPHQSVRLVLL